MLPIVRVFTKYLGITVEIRDISLVAVFSPIFPNTKSDQCLSEHLSKLGQLVVTPETNIVKLPNIRASLPRLKAAIKELQRQGWVVQDYVDELNTDTQKRPKAATTKSKVARSTRFFAKANLIRRAPPVSEELRSQTPALHGRMIGIVSIPHCPYA